MVHLKPSCLPSYQPRLCAGKGSVSHVLPSLSRLPFLPFLDLMAEGRVSRSGYTSGACSFSHGLHLSKSSLNSQYSGSSPQPGAPTHSVSAGTNPEGTRKPAEHKHNPISSAMTAHTSAVHHFLGVGEQVFLFGHGGARNRQTNSSALPAHHPVCPRASRCCSRYARVIWLYAFAVVDL